MEMGGIGLLQLAARTAQKEVVECVVENLPTALNREDSQGNLPLFEAARRGNMEIYDYLLEKGVSLGDILEDPGGLDTYDSCVRARRVFGLDELTVISQAFHVPRAIAICLRAGIDAVGVGDTTMRQQSPRNYRKGQVRELASCWPRSYNRPRSGTMPVKSRSADHSSDGWWYLS